MLKGNVAVFVSDRTAEKCNIALERGVKQILLSVEVDKLDDFILGALVHASALDARVDKGTEAGLCNKSGASRRDLTPEVYDNSLRQAIGFDLLLARHVAQRKGTADVRACPLAYEPGSRLSEAGDSAGAMLLVRFGQRGSVPAVKAVAVAPVAYRRALLQIQSARMSSFPEAVSDCAGNFFCPAGKSHAGQTHSRAVRYEPGCLPGSNYLCHVSSCSRRYYFGCCRTMRLRSNTAAFAAVLL